MMNLSPFAPDFQAFQAAEMMDIVLRVCMPDRLSRYFLQASLTGHHGTTLIISALRDQCSCRTAMAGIHTTLL